MCVWFCRLYYLGRTETIRPVSDMSVQFVKVYVGGWGVCGCNVICIWHCQNLFVVILVCYLLLNMYIIIVMLSKLKRLFCTGYCESMLECKSHSLYCAIHTINKSMHRTPNKWPAHLNRCAITTSFGWVCCDNGDEYPSGGVPIELT